MLWCKKLNRDYKTRRSHWSFSLMWRAHLIRPEQAISATLSNLPGGRMAGDRGTGGLSTGQLPFPPPDVVSGYGRTREAARPRGLLRGRPSSCQREIPGRRRIEQPSFVVRKLSEIKFWNKSPKRADQNSSVIRLERNILCGRPLCLTPCA